MDYYLERELSSRLAKADARSRFFGDTVRQSLHDCEQFRQGTLSYAQALQERGYEPTADRDQLVLDFVQHGARWRRTLVEPSTPAVSARPEEQNGKRAAEPTTERFVLAVDDAEAENVLLNEKDAAKFLNLTSRTLQGYRYKGGGPPYVPFSARAIRYRFSDLRAWVKSRLRSSTSDPGGTLDPDDPLGPGKS